MPNLDALFSPRSIALVGASPDPHTIRGRMVSAVLDGGYPGTVYAISRSHRAIRGLSCYRSVADLPEAVDLAIVTVPARYVADVLEACGEGGTRAAVIISSGFAEERGAEGRARQERVTALAERYDMAVLGPNGEGFLNAALPLRASFSPVLADGAPPSAPGKRARGVAVISQSGGIGFSFYDRGRPRCLPFSYVVSTGNEAGLSTLDVLEHLVSDPATGVVMMFIEGLRDAERFAPLAARAARARKALIVTKVGRSDAAARAALSHTASITGSHSAYEAMFRAHGALSFPDADRMLNAAAALSYFHDRLPRGRRTAVPHHIGRSGDLDRRRLRGRGARGWPDRRRHPRPTRRAPAELRLDHQPRRPHRTGPVRAGLRKAPGDARGIGCDRCGSGVVLDGPLRSHHRRDRRPEVPWGKVRQAHPVQRLHTGEPGSGARARLGELSLLHERTRRGQRARGARRIPGVPRFAARDDALNAHRPEKR